MASAAFSSSPTPLSRKPYDVFLSFRGEDTRRSFAARLHTALSQKQIRTWKDNLNLEKGAKVWDALVDAINNSYFCIVVFSKHYASSTWCLKELAYIVKTKEEKQVIPVFYEIDPSHVRKQTGSYETAFLDHEKDPRLAKEAGIWRDFLRKASNYAGFHSKSTEYR